MKLYPNTISKKENSLSSICTFSWFVGCLDLGAFEIVFQISRTPRHCYSWAMAYCACNRMCGWGLFGHFFSRLSFSLLSPSLWETARYRLKYCLKGPLTPKQPTNQQVGRMRIIRTLLDSIDTQSVPLN